MEEQEEELEYSELDAESERTAVLNGSRISIDSKFLQCVAQLLSPSKGWDSVTATGLREQHDYVEIDVARNDCFGLSTRNSQTTQEECDKAARDQCDGLQSYLGTATQPASPTVYETAAIAYAGQRVDVWAEQVRIELGRLSGDEEGAWTKLVKGHHDMKFEANTPRETLVRNAYECVNLPHTVFKGTVRSKLWRALQMLARPIADCRMLWTIARKYSHFRNVRFTIVPPTSKTAISPHCQVNIFQAWEQLMSKSPTDSQMEILTVRDQAFRRNISGSYGLHAEIQLYMYYEHSPQLTLGLAYFGTSKKACLLCETFLQALPKPIETRGRHGICYPAWGVPQSESTGTMIALEKLEQGLVSRIIAISSSSSRRDKTIFVLQEPQSTIVSPFPSATYHAMQQNEENIRLARDAEAAKRERRLILEGTTSILPSTESPNPNYHPPDCCIMCNRTPAKRCRQCLSCHYCSTQCQASDWPSHKLLCKSFSTQISRPNRDYRRAILFPQDHSKPRMVWLPWERRIHDQGFGRPESYEWVDPHPYLGVDHPNVDTRRIETNPIRGRNLGSGMVYWAPRKEGYSICLKFRDAFLKDGSTVNKSMEASVGRSSSTTPLRLCGPMIAIQKTSLEAYEDITLADFRHIIDYLICYGSTGVRESSSRSTDRPLDCIYGVKLCSYGEMKLHGCEPFVSVDVPRLHPTRLTYAQGTKSTISELLGTPVKLWKFPHTETEFEPPGWDENMTANSNRNAAFMMLETDLKAEGWGFAPLEWNIELGNVLAIRTDGDDLATEDIRMMCSFIQQKLQPMFEDALGSGCHKRTKQEVLGAIDRKNMMDFIQAQDRHGGR